MMMNGGNGNSMFGVGGTMYAGLGSESMFGGNGIDTVVFGGMHRDFQVTNSTTGCLVADTSGRIADMLYNIERLHFSDMNLAFDDAALNTARIVGAAFGAARMDPTLAGIGISLFDQGMTMHDVAGVALNAMGGQMSNQELVTALYTNVVGQAPDNASLMYYTDMLDHGTSRAEMLILAANSDANAHHIDLVGMMSHGLEYL